MIGGSGDRGSDKKDTRSAAGAAPASSTSDMPLAFPEAAAAAAAPAPADAAAAGTPPAVVPTSAAAASGDGGFADDDADASSPAAVAVDTPPAVVPAPAPAAAGAAPADAAAAGTPPAVVPTSAATPVPLSVVTTSIHIDAILRSIRYEFLPEAKRCCSEPKKQGSSECLFSIFPGPAASSTTTGYHPDPKAGDKCVNVSVNYDSRSGLVKSVTVKTQGSMPPDALVLAYQGVFEMLLRTSTTRDVSLKLTSLPSANIDQCALALGNAVRSASRVGKCLVNIELTSDEAQNKQLLLKLAEGLSASPGYLPTFADATMQAYFNNALDDARAKAGTGAGLSVTVAAPAVGAAGAFGASTSGAPGAPTSGPPSP